MFKKIYVEITNTCNLNCKFCPETSRQKRFMTCEEFKMIIAKIKDYTKTVYLHVKGEPLLNENLASFLAILKGNNLTCNITTNRILLMDKVDILKNAEAVRQINISLHSVVENNLDCDNYLERVLKAADLLDNKIISLRLWNLNSLSENTINDIIINQLSTHYKITNLKDKLKNKSYFKINDKVFINQDIKFTWPDINKDEINEKGRCLALKDQIAILVDGSVVPCCLDNNGDITLGNIYNETLEDILNKELTQKIKKGFENGKIVCKLCKTCGFLKRLEAKRKYNINGG